MKNRLNICGDAQIHLFEKGFLITDSERVSSMGHPFCDCWKRTVVGKFNFWIHQGTTLFLYKDGKKTFFLIGHAFNPFTWEYDETIILSKLAKLHGKPMYYDAVNELTGIFILGVVEGEGIECLLDASGQQYGCYGIINGNAYISSHMRLIGDVCDLETSDYVQRLTTYRWYRYMMGFYLPGDITCFSETKRIVPNTYIVLNNHRFEVVRFYPNKRLNMCQTEEEYEQVIEEAAQILKNTMEIIPMKWKRPAISLTGGIDSNTTFAAANGMYSKYTTFSYVAMASEAVDAEKAEEISKRFDVPYVRYDIPESNDAITDFSTYKAVLDYNHGGIGSSKDNDARKKIILMQKDVCDVEVKSWVSETIRAYAYKYFGRVKFPKQLTARNYTALYKIFVLNRKLVWETDACFGDYLERTKLKSHLFNYDETDFFVWEHMHGGKCSLDIGVMRSCFDITIPYNNRKLLDLLLRVPLAYRISDRHHMDLKKRLNPELFDMNIRVVNMNQTDTKKKIANFFYTINSFLPF